MNPLQTNPELFANGKFKLDHCGVKFPITGYDSRQEVFQVLNDIGNTINAIAKDCTLIARPIEDMTDEEYTHFFGWSQNNFEKDRELIENYASNGGTMDSDGFLYLLSIGVYPFDQSHFGDTVIDTRTLKTKG